MKILVLEDDLALSVGLCFELDSNGYITVAAYNCQKARQLLKNDTFDLAILDVNLPDGNGFDLCREVKAVQPELPVIFLTANDLEQDVLNGFDLGADDYITKPFNMQILLRRVEVALRRSAAAAKPAGDFWSDGFLSLDFGALTAVCNGEKLAITPNEYKLLKVLTENAGNIITRQIFLERLWDCDGNFIDDHTLTVTMNRLRAKIEDKEHTYIKTVRGMGYIWTGGKSMKSRWLRIVKTIMILAAAALFAVLFWLLWEFVPRAGVRYALMAVCQGIFAAAGGWSWCQRRQVIRFSDELCETLDALIAGRQPEQFQLYEDSVTAKVQGKLQQYYDIMNEGRLQSQRDKQTLQELVSDISHQVKTPIANIRMFTEILQKHSLPKEKQTEFIGMMGAQIHKLDFLLQSLIKMSRLETGTFALHMEETPLNDTIAQAISLVWAKADKKNIDLSVSCDSAVTVQHDSKWTAEAIGNILDNAVKYTPENGSVSVSVRPWQFYTRIDIEDTGIGIPKEHYNDVFQRFYRAQEVAAEEGVGLGLYLANGIITRQKGYISVKSTEGEGTTFSVYLLS